MKHRKWESVMPPRPDNQFVRNAIKAFRELCASGCPVPGIVIAREMPGGRVKFIGCMAIPITLQMVGEDPIIMPPHGWGYDC